jgi:hypothetical protein
MAMNRSLFKKQLQLGLNTVFGMEYNRYPEEWRDIFDINTSVKAYEEDVLMAGLGTAPVKAEGAGVSFDEGAESYVARYIHNTVALAFAITQEAEEDGLYGSIAGKYSKSLARGLQNTKEVTGANVLNNGFSASYPGGDGVALFSISHPIWGGGVQANMFTTQPDLCESALEAADIAIGLWVDERGIRIAAKPKRLIVPNGNKYVAQRLLFSDFRPATGDNDINALKSIGTYAGGVSVNHYLTDPIGWYIKTDVADGLKHFVRKKVERGLEGEFETGNMRYKARERYSFGWSDYRGCWGSAGT